MYVVVPTHTNPPTLATLLTNAGMPSIIVRTTAGLPIIGDHTIDDHGPINISRWWNLGMDHARELGATYAVVANHDINVADNHQLPRLVAALERTGATLAYPAPHNGPPKTQWAGKRDLTGWCFAINLTHELRAPEEYRWWFGDDWLDHQARTNHHGIVPVHARITHNKGSTAYPPHFTGIVNADTARWRATHGRPW